MKAQKTWSFISLVVFGCYLILAAPHAYTQTPDTVYVDPGVGTLEAAVNDPANAGKVFKLTQRGQAVAYTVTENIGADHDLVIVGPPDDGTPPPVLLRSADLGTGKNASVIRTNAGLRLENVAVMGITLQGEEMTYVIFLETADGADYEFYNCYFDRTSNAIIRCLAANPRVVLKDCLILNAACNTNYQGGFVVRYRQIVPRETLVQNCTVINMGSTFITNIKSYINTGMTLDHNTFILANRDFVTPNDNWIDYEMKNNIFIDMFARGYCGLRTSNSDTVYFGDYIDDPHDSLAGFLHWDTLSAEYHDEYPEAERDCKFHHNNWYRGQTMLDWYAATGYTEMPFMNSRSQAMEDDDATWPGIEIDEPGSGTSISVDPEFTKPLPDSCWTNYQAWIQYHRTTEAFKPPALPNKIWDFDDQPMAPMLWGDDLKQVLDLSYPETNPCYTAAEDGLPLGDLNWFPEKKEEWLTDVANTAAVVPTEFEMLQNYPNPFNPGTTICYRLNEPVEITLTIYNMLGQKVRTLADGKKMAGTHQIVWEGKDDFGNMVPSGVYFTRLKHGTETITNKMVLMK